MTVKTKKSELEAKLDAVGVALLDAAYGAMMSRQEQAEGDLPAPPVEINPNVFRSVVDWIRAKNKLEPDGDESSGLDSLKSKLGK